MADLSARGVAEALVADGITDLVGLPDNASAALFRAAALDQRLRLLTVTREGEAFAVASGLWIGGRAPAVVCQNTGLLESGDSLRGTAVRMAVPLLILVTFRGYQTLPGDTVGGAPETMQRPDIDSVALMTEPTLEAWRLPWAVLDGPTGIYDAIHQARSESRPVVRLVTSALR